MCVRISGASCYDSNLKECFSQKEKAGLKVDMVFKVYHQTPQQTWTLSTGSLTHFYDSTSVMNKREVFQGISL